jgi:hypothetical protein
MKRQLATALLSLICFAAHAKWEAYAFGPDHWIFADNSTFKRNGYLVKIWTLWDYDTVRDFDGKKYRSTISLMEIDCKDDLSRIIFATFYEGKKGTDKKVHEVNQPNIEWRPLQPNTAETRLSAWWCLYFPK